MLKALLHVSKQGLVLGYPDYLKASMASEKPQQQGGHIVPLTVQNRRVKLTPSQPDKDYLRAQSLNRIKLMVKSDLGATRLGQMLYELASDKSNETKITSTLSNAFAKKASHHPSASGRPPSGHTSETLRAVIVPGSTFQMRIRVKTPRQRGAVGSETFHRA